MAKIPSDAKFGVLGHTTDHNTGCNTGYSSALKQMQIMHEKGLLRRTERYRLHVYEAAITRNPRRKSR
jgi:hypothetical protein